MKIKKLLTLVLAMILAVACVSMVACGETEEDDAGTGGNATLRMEAEYIDLDDVRGAGISSDQQGVEMIYGDGEKDASKWSNGYFVGYTYAADLKLTFKFTAEKDGNGTITMALGSEHGTLTFNNTNLKIELNGQEISYANQKVEGSELSEMKFKACKITTNAAIKAGENEITITVLENTMQANGKTAGPCIDYVEVKSAGNNLSWTPKTENPSNKGSM